MTIRDAHFIIRCNKTIEFIAVERVLKDNGYTEANKKAGKGLIEPTAILVRDSTWTRARINFDRVTITNENRRLLPAARFLLTPLQKIKQDVTRAAVFYDNEVKIEVLGHLSDHAGHVQIGGHIISPQIVDEIYRHSQQARIHQARRVCAADPQHN